MKFVIKIWILIFFSKSTRSSIGLRCDMIPEGVISPKLKDTDRYRIEISGNPEYYIPKEQYTVILKGAKKYNGSQIKFTHFIISLTNEKFEKDIESESTVIGTIQLYGDTLTKFSDSCQNAVIQADPQPKTEIQILWMAPSRINGCIKFRATVVESVDNWYSEDGELTKILCAESPDDDDVQPKLMKHCCACDEAKYEVIFEGLWSRNTHPKDFPSEG